MARISLLVLASALSVSHAFIPMKQPSQKALRMVDERESSKVVERGVSFDQDGKSNVWAIEPKVSVENKSAEEQTTSALIAGGGIAVAAVAAALILTHLPDPNQF